ncbi:MAG: stage II sporulation protein M [Patescibacteria group bacterium]
MKPSKYYYILAVAIFIVAIASGMIFGKNFPGADEYAENSFAPFGFLKNLSPFFIFLIIFLNNTIKTLIMILLGFLLGIYPFYFIATNGFLLGLVMIMVGDRLGYPVVIAGILPHGIFELTALIIGTAYGFWLGVRFAKKIRFRYPFRPYLNRALAVYLKIILPLLFVAAVIEAWLTPWLINLTLD